MKNGLLKLFVFALMGSMLLSACQNDEMLMNQTDDFGNCTVEQVIKGSLKTSGCIDPANPVYFKQTVEQTITWGNKKSPFTKTVTVVMYNTDQQFVLEVASSNGFANFIVNGASVWHKGPVAPNVWGSYQFELPENWQGGDQMALNLQVAGNGPQAVFDLSYLLVGICTGGYGSMVDNEGNVYETVEINNLEWMRENLRTMKFNNGEPIPTGFTAAEWMEYVGPAVEIYWALEFGYEWELTREEIHQKYGALYNYWAAADERGICPDGWRMPTQADWQSMIAYVKSIDPVASGNQLKSSRLGYFVDGEGWYGEHPYWYDWDHVNYGTDKYGFSAIPGGHRNFVGGFGNLGYEAHYWSSTYQYGSQDPTRAYAFGMRADDPNIYMFDSPTIWAFNVRCVRDVQ